MISEWDFRLIQNEFDPEIWETKPIVVVHKEMILQWSIRYVVSRNSSEWEPDLKYAIFRSDVFVEFAKSIEHAELLIERNFIKHILPYLEDYKL